MEETTMTIEEMKNRKRELGYTIDKLSALSGVPVSTLRKLFSGHTKSPRQDTIEKLVRVLEDDHYREISLTRFLRNESHTMHYASPTSGTGEFVKKNFDTYGSSALKEEDGDVVKTAQVDNPYGNKMQGDYTVEDYLKLPDDKRYELIDGVIFEMDAPTSNHQVLAGYLYHKLMSCIEEHPEVPCYPYIAPLDVQLDKDEKTMVEPDVIIACDPALNIGTRLFGAPEFLCEVVSPSSKKKDMFIKLNKYLNAGVKEYWMIDPEKQTVVVYLFYKEDQIAVYSFDDTIPVSISDGICNISFASVKNRLVKIDR